MFVVGSKMHVSCVTYHVVRCLFPPPFPLSSSPPSSSPSSSCIFNCLFQQSMVPSNPRTPSNYWSWFFLSWSWCFEMPFLWFFCFSAKRNYYFHYLNVSTAYMVWLVMTIKLVILKMLYFQSEKLNAADFSLYEILVITLGWGEELKKKLLWKTQVHFFPVVLTLRTQRKNISVRNVTKRHCHTICLVTLLH